MIQEMQNQSKKKQTTEKNLKQNTKQKSKQNTEKNTKQHSKKETQNKQTKRRSNAYTVAQLGMFIAVAMVFSYVESFIKIDIAVPGIKIGLANIVTILVLHQMGLADAVIVSALRIFLSSLLFGNVTIMIYSLAGAAVSILLMWISEKIGFFSVAGTSILGGVGHNMGQLLVAYFIIKNQNVLIYAPVLILSGTVTGILIGIAAAFVIRAVGGQIGNT